MQPTSPLRLSGESGGIRTHSLPVKSRKLNQLSYTLILLAERAELESDTVTGTIRLAGGPQTFRVHAPYGDLSGRSLTRRQATKILNNV